jgi:circadian clock protein KaiC
MLVGGIPRGRTVLIEGLEGTGKTILSLHFILAGIFQNTKNPEPAVYVCLDESPADLIKEAAEFGWDLQKLIGLGQIALVDGFSGRLGLEPDSDFPYAVPVGKFSVDQVIARITEANKKLHAKRLVIDPVSALLDGLKEKERREAVLSLTAVLKELSLTTFITSELEQAGIGIERYAAHGVIRLDYDVKEKTVGRKLRIVKMRETMHSMNIISYEIKAKGFELRV